MVSSQQAVRRSERRDHLLIQEIGEMKLSGHHRRACVTLSFGPAQLFTQPVSEPFWGTDLAEKSSWFRGEGRL